MQTTSTSRPTQHDDAGQEKPSSPVQRSRADYARVEPEAYRVHSALEGYVRGTGLEHTLLELVRLRASYLNGCAYCVDMHTKDARLSGENEQRLYAVPVWRETPFFTARERAALAWTDALTLIADDGVPDSVYAAAREEFDERALVALTMAVVAINGWNRLSVAFGMPVGSYVAGTKGAART